MTVADILQFVAEHFEEPCNYNFSGVGVIAWMSLPAPFESQEREE